MIKLICVTSRLSYGVKIEAIGIFVTGSSENTTDIWFWNPQMT